MSSIIAIREFIYRKLWSSGKGKGLGCHHISGSIHLLCETESHFPNHLHGYGLLLFDPFEYPEKGLSMGCTSHPGVRSVFLIDQDLTFFFKKKKREFIEIVTKDSHESLIRSRYLFVFANNDYLYMCWYQHLYFG